MNNYSEPEFLSRLPEGHLNGFFHLIEPFLGQVLPENVKNHAHSLVFSGLKKEVRTPLGVGVLKGVSFSRAAVVLKGYRKCTHYRVDEVVLETEEAEGDDPRPELGDSARWVALITQASPELRIVLRGFRGMGCEVKQVDKGLGIRPIIGNRWFSDEAYKEARRKWAKPYVEEIARLLGR